MGHVNRENARRPDGSVYDKVIDKIAEEGFCPFCPEHLHETHPNPILADNAEWVATDNAYPYKHTDHHLLFIHKEHIEDIRELTTDGWAGLHEIVQQMLDERKIEGAALVMRFGKTALTGATVSHLHAQLVSGTGNPDTPVTMRVG